MSERFRKAMVAYFELKGIDPNLVIAEGLFVSEGKLWYLEFALDSEGGKVLDDEGLPERLGRSLPLTPEEEVLLGYILQ